MYALQEMMTVRTINADRHTTNRALNPQQLSTLIPYLSTLPVAATPRRRSSWLPLPTSLLGGLSPLALLFLARRIVVGDFDPCRLAWRAPRPSDWLPRIDAGALPDAFIVGVHQGLEVVFGGYFGQDMAWNQHVASV